MIITDSRELLIQTFSIDFLFPMNSSHLPVHSHPLTDFSGWAHTPGSEEMENEAKQEDGETNS